MDVVSASCISPAVHLCTLLLPSGSALLPWQQPVVEACLCVFTVRVVPVWKDQLGLQRLCLSDVTVRVEVVSCCFLRDTWRFTGVGEPA